jgi:S1-C subfamily serine protease
MGPDVLSQLSTRLADLVSGGAASVLRLDGRRRGPASAVAWSPDGVAVTTHHAVERDEALEVGLPSGETVSAEVIGRDPTTDLAALRVRSTGLTPPRWIEDGSLAAGQLVVGVSRPGKNPRASLGLLSRVAAEFRAPGGGRIERYLETSLEIHAGFSGGLVLAAGGEAAGLASAGLVRGTAMVLPPSTLRRVMKALLSRGGVRRGWLGVATVPVTLDPALRATTGEHVALLVTRVEPESPAARAGLLFGDGLLSFGNATLQDPGELLGLLVEERIGDAVPMKVLRAGEVRDVTVTIGARDQGGRS